MAVNPFEPSVRKNDDAALADPKKPGGPSDYSDPSPVNAEHVMNLMRSNFPEDAIGWVMRARWVGPIQVPWERIDKDGIDDWAASHQQEAVNRFARDIKAGTGHTNPSILIQDNDSPKAIIIDGHHRALAHHKLGQPVLAYLGQIEPGDRMAAEETHSKQVHSGSDPRNKNLPSGRWWEYPVGGPGCPGCAADREQKIESLLTKLDGFWFSRETGRPAQRKEIFKALAGLRDAGYDERLLALQARGFGWTVEQLDNEFLRTWLCGNS